MGKTAANVLGAVLLIALAAIGLFGWIGSMEDGHGEAAHTGFKVEITMPSSLGEMERTPAVFDHEVHIEKVKDGDSCLVSGCHEIGDDSMMEIYVFKAGEGETAAKYADAYHENCIGCHRDGTDAPVKKCGKCHEEDRIKIHTPQAVELDLRQHEKHVVAFDQECSACHHVYDESKKELIYLEGEEASCRDCHLEEEGDAPYMRQATHEKCIACHVSRKDSEKTGPTTCEGCHIGETAAPPIADMSDVERLETGQEDEPFLLVDGADFEGVVFDHMNHESNARNCRTCHHKSLSPCSDCHTLEGKEEGGNVKLANAFHDADSTHSCVGCHETAKKKPECSVCHSSMMKGPADASCDTCHAGQDDDNYFARLTWELNEVIPTDFEIPDTIDISAIQKDLQAVEFPHREIIDALGEMIGEDKLANVFHGGRPVVCAACHHESPLGEKPPECAKCHAEPFDARNPHKPGIRSAFHLQCVGCHREMNIGDFRDCSSCHKDKDVNLPGNFKEVKEEMKESE